MARPDRLGKDIAGQGPSHATYEQVVIEAQSELRRLREALLGITIKGPDGSAPGLERIIATAQELWNKYVPATRQSIGEEPQPWLAGCDSLVYRIRLGLPGLPGWAAAT
jgi:hypothetical protein